jgi:hypothetical protein
MFFTLSMKPSKTPEGSVEGDLFREIENAIGLGNAKLLSAHMSSSVELDIPGSEGVYSRPQSEQILNKFFNKYPPTSFILSHKGNSAAGSKFAVGDYMTGKEQTFRVTIFLKKTGEHYLIHEIEFQ